MGCGSGYVPKPGPCPVCRKSEGAHTGSTGWGHNFMCCSEECGTKAMAIIEKNAGREEYKNKLRRLRNLKDELMAMRTNGLVGFEFDPFSSIF